MFVFQPARPEGLCRDTEFVEGLVLGITWSGQFGSFKALFRLKILVSNRLS